MKKIFFIMMIFMLAFGKSSSAIAGCDKMQCYTVIDSYLECIEDEGMVNMGRCTTKYSSNVQNYCDCYYKNEIEHHTGSILCSFCINNFNYPGCQDILRFCPENNEHKPEKFQ